MFFTDVESGIKVPNRDVLDPEMPKGNTRKDKTDEVKEESN